MKKKFLSGAAKKAQIALAVMAVCGMSFAGADRAYAADLNDKIIINGSENVKLAGSNSIAIGSGAYSLNDNCIAIGTNASTGSGDEYGYSVALGKSALATGNLSTAIGAAAEATHFSSIAIGYNSETTKAYSIAVGFESTTRYITGVRAGEDDTDAVNVKQMNDAFDNKVGTAAQITSTNVISASNNVNQNLSAIDAAIGTYSDDAAKNIDKNASVKANISALDNEIGSYDPNTTQNVISTDKDIKSNLSSIDKYMGDIQKIGTEDYSIIDRTGKKVDGDTLNVADILNVIDDKVGDLNKENKYVVEDEDGNLVEIGSYNHIDGQTSLAENMEELDAVIGKTADGTYVSSKASVGENLNALDTQVAANTNAINRLDNKVNKVGAGAAALAALHPLDFDPDDKLTFAAGFGNYQGENAVALGAFYRPDEKVMFSVAGNMGNGENMINAGVSFALDRTHKGTPSKAVMAKKLAAQDEQLAALNNTVATQSQEIAELKAMVKELSAKK